MAPTVPGCWKELAPDTLRWSSPYLAPGHPQWACIPGSVGAAPFLTGLEEGLLQTLCLDTRSGRLLWKQQAPKVTLAPHHKASSPAASTPCVDQQRVYVYFDSYGLLCYDHEGNEMWKRPIPLRSHFMECPALPSLPMEKFF